MVPGQSAVAKWVKVPTRSSARWNAHLSRELHDLVAAHADAVHARVHRQMEGRGHAEGVGGLGVADGELGGVDRSA